ncbi:uncharacterized protein LOC130670395 [Microplitis mediator]|uniref:uncharacterized protein LOC130670395 n=1 Tax=Microplitis mediator TaxID=375433 RepID=UPI002554F608|nr:uncharacterized protein LOC130670395 [Microplitis mediator]
MEFSCSMCFFKSLSSTHLLQHIIRHHQHDPKFQIQCKQIGCGRTFTKWKSFRQHLFRKHPTVQVPTNDINEVEEHVNNNLLDDQYIPFNNYVDNQDDIRELTLTPEEILELQSAQFSVNIRENCKVSQKAMETIMEGVTSLVNVYLSIVMGEIKKSTVDNETVNLTDIKNICADMYPPSTIFSSVRSKKALDKILTDKFNMNLKNLVSNKEVYFNIMSNPENSDYIYRTVLDGKFYKNNEFFKNNKNALAIVFYYDDLGVANPLGATAKAHKLSMFYWTLANIRPEVRSSLNTIQLYAIVKTEHLKQPNAINKILQPFISDIIELQTIGINITVNGQMKNFKGTVLFCAGDTPASAMLGGYKESVSAYRPCRTCMTTNQEWREDLPFSNFVLRNKIDHQEQIDIVTDPSITKVAREFWKKTYGVNKRSPLADIPFCDATLCFPQDAMHVLIEGVGEIGCRAFLRYCIFEKNLFTLDSLNERLQNFDFKHFQNEKPALILDSHLTEDGHLRQSAAQFLTLFHTLPFLIGDWLMESDDSDLEEHISCYMQMLNIINVTLAYEIDENSVDHLDRIIKIFLNNFNSLYPNLAVPKFHFLRHIPYYIKLFGPARQQWCFRFEAAYAYFKGLVAITRNFKNLAVTLSYRHQARLCLKLCSPPGMPAKKFLYRDDYVVFETSIMGIAT